MRKILAFLIIFMLLFSVFFEAFEAHHECDGEDCAICLCLDSVSNILSGLKTAAGPAAVPVLTVIFLAALSVIENRKMSHATPIDLRTQMNN